MFLSSVVWSPPRANIPDPRYQDRVAAEKTVLRRAQDQMAPEQASISAQRPPRWGEMEPRKLCRSAGGSGMPRIGSVHGERRWFEPRRRRGRRRSASVCGCCGRRSCSGLPSKHALATRQRGIYCYKMGAAGRRWHRTRPQTWQVAESVGASAVAPNEYRLLHSKHLLRLSPTRVRARWRACHARVPGCGPVQGRGGRGAILGRQTGERSSGRLLWRCLRRSI